jgi:hypothetical protein
VKSVMKYNMFAPQMKEYHARAAAQDPDPHPSSPQPQSDTGNSWDQLAEQYGLDDMMELEDNVSQAEQTVDEEFSAYTSSPLSPRDTNIIKFWEVSCHKDFGGIFKMTLPSSDA